MNMIPRLVLIATTLVSFCYSQDQSDFLSQNFNFEKDQNCLSDVLEECTSDNCKADKELCAIECLPRPLCAGVSFGNDGKVPPENRCILRKQICASTIHDTFTFYGKKDFAGAPAPAPPAPPSMPPAPPSMPPAPPSLPAVPAPSKIIYDPNNLADTCTATQEQRSEGKEFILMFMTNYASDPLFLPLELYVTAGSSVAPGKRVPVTISAPGMPEVFAEKQITVTSGSVERVEVARELKMAGNTLNKQCVKVVGDDYLVVYGVNKERFTSDGFLGIAVPGLGNEYYAVTHYPARYQCELGVAATQSDTKVTITFPERPGPDIDPGQQQNLQVQFNGRQYGFGSKLTATMDECSTLQIQSGTTGDLTGTRIEADKPIAVFSGNSRTNVPGRENPKYTWNTRDHLVEQMPSVESWGREFVTCPTPHRTTGDIFFFVASKPNTVINLKGEKVNIKNNQVIDPMALDEEIRLTKAGHYKRMIIDSDVFTSIKANNGILVVQIVMSQQYDGSPEEADPAMIVIPPVQQYDYKYAFSTSKYAGAADKKYVQNLIVMAEDDFKDEILINGKKIGEQALGEQPIGFDGPPVTWVKVGTTKWSCGYTSVAFGSHSIRHKNSAQGEGASKSFGAILYGAGDRESYAYPIGMKTAKLNVVCQPCVATPCDAADNDCDGNTNEEICDGKDDDGDGYIDEDCCGEPEPTEGRSGFFPPPKQDVCEVREEQRSEGKDFMVMFMENRVADPQNIPLEIYVTAGSSVKTGTQFTAMVATPGVMTNGPQTISVEAGKVTKVNLPNEVRMIGTGMEKKCVTITGKENMVVYGVNKETFTNDGFLGIAVAGLGKEHFVVTQYPPTYHCEFGVAATEDRTQVTITFPSAGDGSKGNLQVTYLGRLYTWGQKLKIEMNKCDTLQIQSGTSGDLTGTSVVGNKHIAVFSGNARTNVPGEDTGPGLWGSRDHLVEQIPPTASWAKKFILCPIPERLTGDIFVIVASKDDTQIKIEGQRLDLKSGLSMGPFTKDITLKKAGDFERFHIESDLFTQVTSNNGIMVVQFVMSQKTQQSLDPSDPAMIIVPPVAQYDFKYAFSTSEYAGRTGAGYKQNLMVIAEKKFREKIKIDDKNIGEHGSEVKWVDVPDTTWSCGYTKVEEKGGRTGSHSIVSTARRSPNEMEPFGAILYGAGDRESYAFPIGMKTQSVNVECSKCKMTPCDAADNDCDGKNNEELCDGEDDDGDGLIDEDCCGPLSGRAGNPPSCNPMDTKRTCFGSDMSIKCPRPGLQLKVLQAHFGRMGYDGDDTCGPNPRGNPVTGDVDCGFANMYNTVAPRCDGKESCSMKVDSELLGMCGDGGACKLCSKYLEISYQCLRAQSAKCNVYSTIEQVALHEGVLSASSWTNTAIESGTCASGAYKSKYACDGDCGAPKAPLDGDLCSPKWGIFASDNTHAWCPEKCDQKNAFLQVDLGNKYEVKGAAWQGCRKFDKWISKYHIKHSNDGKDWTKMDYTLKGNSNSYSVQFCAFDSFIARYVRFYVEDYSKHPCGHVEIMRCSEVKK